MKKGIHKGRAAFLLNMNAKSVTPELKQKITKLVPPKDLYFSKSMEEARDNLKKIIDQRYAFVFSGGGDGTVVGTINILRDLSSISKYPLPTIGVLRLGTGNALARMLGASSYIDDIKDILSGKKIDLRMVSMVETEEGLLTPFAGIGYDGDILNDFHSMKGFFFASPFRKIFTSFLGFALVGLFKTLPRQMKKKPVIAHVSSNYPCYKIVNIKGRDEEIFIDAKKPLFDGNAALISVGTVSSVGYDFKLFPFAEKRPGYMHLRICAVPLSVCLANFYPSIWKGHFRHAKLYDYLVKDVKIESDQQLPYQFAGDAMGHKKRLYFFVTKEPVAMASIHRSKKRMNLPSTPVLTPFS